uniref:Uncharacterized protein n=1 Tax=Hippocampus comes TaxID=109280 RepID=A0A3Q2Y144_HIPCM
SIPLHLNSRHTADTAVWSMSCSGIITWAESRNTFTSPAFKGSLVSPPLKCGQISLAHRCLRPQLSHAQSLWCPHISDSHIQ